MNYKRPSPVFFVLLSVIALAGLIQLYQYTQASDKMTIVQEKLPVIRLALGNDFLTVRRQSTYQFKRTELNRIDLIMSDTPVIFEYTRPGCEFSLPPALSFGASMNDLHTINVVVSPHLAYLVQDEAFGLIENLYILFESSGWKLTRRRFSIAQAKETFANPKTDNDYRMRLQEWQCNEDELYIEIARNWMADESLPQLSGKRNDLYVVTVKIENNRVRSQYTGTRR